jgi:hypothetical protein
VAGGDRWSDDRLVGDPSVRQLSEGIRHESIAGDPSRPGVLVATDDHDEGAIRALLQRGDETAHGEPVGRAGLGFGAGVSMPHPDKRSHPTAPIQVVGDEVFDAYNTMIEMGLF